MRAPHAAPSSPSHTCFACVCAHGQAVPLCWVVLADASHCCTRHMYERWAVASAAACTCACPFCACTSVYQRAKLRIEGVAKKFMPMADEAVTLLDVRLNARHDDRTTVYMAPELRGFDNDVRLSAAVDMFSYGVLAWYHPARAWKLACYAGRASTDSLPTPVAGRQFGSLLWHQ